VTTAFNSYYGYLFLPRLPVFMGCYVYANTLENFSLCEHCVSWCKFCLRMHCHLSPCIHTHSLVYIQLFNATGKYCIGLCMIAFTMEWEFPDVLAIALTNRWVKLGFCIAADLKTCSWFISWQMSADSSKRQLTYYALWKMGNDRRAVFSYVENIISQGVTILDIAWHAALEIWTNCSSLIEFYIWRRITDCLLQSDCPM